MPSFFILADFCGQRGRGRRADCGLFRTDVGRAFVGRLYFGFVVPSLLTLSLFSFFYFQNLIRALSVIVTGRERQRERARIGQRSRWSFQYSVRLRPHLYIPSTLQKLTHPQPCPHSDWYSLRARDDYRGAPGPRKTFEKQPVRGVCAVSGRVWCVRFSLFMEDEGILGRC